mmetsp:Transcript_10502/g.42458  ORF Transcript_10502/g.42458 Transcript_10502/m.42458 type:complete len:314 (-) Transcript_10502:636-1577(-)
MTFAVLVIGPAGVGKTTLCRALQEYGEIHRRGVYVVNLDPAADQLPYTPDVDVRELITVEDAMREMEFGPNGGLVYCMEYLAFSHLAWLETKLRAFGPEDTLLIDCPGQLELYTHVPVMPRLVRAMTEQWDVHVCCAYLMDAVSIMDPSKFVSATLAGLSAMLMLPVPRLTVLSKSDLVQPKEALETFLELGSSAVFLDRCAARDKKAKVKSLTTSRKYRKLTAAFASVVDDHAMLSFVPFSIHDDETAAHVMAFADHLTQYNDHAEVRIPEDERSAVFGDDMDDDDRGRPDLYAGAAAMYGPGSVGDHWAGS